MVKDLEYPFELSPLPEEDGGGWLLTFPDLPDVIAQGDTPEEAIEEGRGNRDAWMAVAADMDIPIPVPGGGASGNFRARVPKSLHARLIARAKAEGVSMNMMLVSILSTGLGLSAREKDQEDKVA